MKKLILLGAMLVLISVVILVLAEGLTGSLVTTRIRKQNPQRTHEIELVKNTRNHIWFRVKLDGEVLHTTRRFRRSLIDYREQLVWAPNGERFFLEVAGERIYGYDLTTHRELSPEEFGTIPLSSFQQTGYEHPPTGTNNPVDLLGNPVARPVENEPLK